MQEKTIKAVFTKKFNDWVSSITDDGVQKAVKDNSIISGGAITSLLLNEKPNDYDIYFRNKETLLKVCHYYADKFNANHPFMQNNFGKRIECTVLDCATIPENASNARVKMMIKSDGVYGTLPANDRSEEGAVINMVTVLDNVASDEVEKTVHDKYNPVYITTNAITLSNSIQLIVRFYGEPDIIHSNYDYEHTKACWCSWNNALIISKSVYECVLNKTLKYTGSLYPICSAFRMRKFISRGWTISAGQILKMAFHINQLNLNDIDILEDQLIGVDSAYFNMLIVQIRKQQAEDAEFKWNASYIISIVDKIF